MHSRGSEPEGQNAQGRQGAPAAPRARPQVGGGRSSNGGMDNRPLAGTLPLILPPKTFR